MSGLFAGTNIVNQLLVVRGLIVEKFPVHHVLSGAAHQPALHSSCSSNFAVLGGLVMPDTEIAAQLFPNRDRHHAAHSEFVRTPTLYSPLGVTAILTTLGVEGRNG